MSTSLILSSGSMDVIALKNSSWNMKLMRAPPLSSVVQRSGFCPSRMLRYSAVNSVMIARRIFEGDPSPAKSSMLDNSAVYF